MESKEKEEDNDSDEDSDEDFSWYDWNDKENIYFTIQTCKRNSYATGSEIFNCYGNRTNRFLLLHYGFAFSDNIYNSLTFHTWDVASSDVEIVEPGSVPATKS